jgi:hypothetical protein
MDEFFVAFLCGKAMSGFPLLREGQDNRSSGSPLSRDCVIPAISGSAYELVQTAPPAL